jgi:hypothetical protein
LRQKILKSRVENQGFCCIIVNILYRFKFYVLSERTTLKNKIPVNKNITVIKISVLWYDLTILDGENVKII